MKDKKEKERKLHKFILTMSLESVTNPFYLPTNPDSLPSYGTPGSAVLSVLYNNLKSIFSYKTFSEPDLLDAALKKWVERHVNNIYFRELEINQGAGLTPLGFAKESLGLTGIIAPGYALPYFVNSFLQSATVVSKFLFTVGALSYDGKTGSITNDYVTPLNAAKNLGFPVVSPVSADEAQIVSLLSIALAKYGSQRGVVNLFDGASFNKTVLPVNEKIDSVALLACLDKVLPATSSLGEIISTFNLVTGFDLQKFRYAGDVEAETIFVTFGSLESQLFGGLLERNHSKVGVISVRIPLPFDTERFINTIPKTAKRIIVLGQSIDSSSPTILKSQVSVALFYHGRLDITVVEYQYEPNFIWSPLAVQHIVSSYVKEFTVTLEDSEAKNFIYWASDRSVNIDLASRLVYGFSLLDDKSISLRTKFDNITNAGIFQAQFSSTPNKTPTFISNVDNTEVTIVEDIDLLKTVDVVTTVKDQGDIIVISKKSFQGKELTAGFLIKELGIPEKFFISAVKKQLRLTFIDEASLTEKEGASGDELSFVTQFLVWKYAFGYSLRNSARIIWDSAGPEKELPASFIEESILLALENDVKEISLDLFKELTISTEEEPEPLPSFINETSFAPNRGSIETAFEPVIESIVDISKKLTFKEAYQTESHLRPDLPIKNYVVKVKENVRITPSYYDRYIFHIEFDITGTGLTYDIGEALGIHARNNEILVKQFIESYGLNKNAIISVPNKDNHNILESRTVLQAFTEHLDIFGKPPKRFYESLIEYATDEVEKKKLEDLIDPAGAVNLKRYQDVKFYTYADIFDLFPSARPNLAELINIISPLKRREYSIASSQRVHPNEVHLLIVVVNWIDGNDRTRYGQASKYIADLAIGSELVVSVKPSVMKLPASPKQPVIMSGLGTGLAPFKAIVEEKLWQKQQGFDIGEVYLYLGSRHKREEYLYGELWEAYKDAGIITHIGAAFSRDQPEKIYIQDRIRESLSDLKTAMIENNGSFYLCGPTWPVPDVTRVLQDILAADAKEKGTKIDLEAAIEELKETSRYILEVY